MPGVLLTGFRKAGAMNPVIMLDEIDKMGRDMRGDPGAALLEVLDPAQNSTFTDHYLGLPFDISKALWIATANDLSLIAQPLQDRMEVIELPGYTVQEKCLIAEKHLIPKQLSDHGLVPITEEIAEAQAQAAEEEPDLEDAEDLDEEGEDGEPIEEEVPAEPMILPERIIIGDNIVTLLASAYTREAGVRSLERQIAALCRATALDVARKTADGTMTTEEIELTEEDVERILGPAKFDDEIAARTGIPGVALGLAWTMAGGDVLFIEATKYAGSGQVKVTGNLGQVMSESCQIAMACKPHSPLAQSSAPT